MLLKDVLFSQGFGTRYDCAAMVASGAVEIAAEVHDDPDEDVETEGLVFRCLGTDWPYFEKAIIALNKPAGYECSMKPSAHPSVMTLLPSPLRRRNMQPVGRLDVDTPGVLIFTDDGALQHRLIHPKRHVSKIYAVVCRHPVDEKTREKRMAGVVLDDDPKPVAAKDVEILDEHHLRMTLVQGKYHQVKRMFAARGKQVVYLKRMAIGGLALDPDLQPGEWRELTEEEVRLLEQPGEEELFQTEQFVCETGILYAAVKETE